MKWNTMIAFVVSITTFFSINVFAEENQEKAVSENMQKCTTGYKPYDEIIQMYLTGMHENWSALEYSEKGLSFIFAGDTIQSDEVGYLLVDLDGNGTDELLMGTNRYYFEPDSLAGIFALYTILDGDWIQLSSWRYAGFSLCTDNSLAIQSKNDQYVDWGFYSIDGSNLKLKERVVQEKAKDGGGKWYYSIVDMWGLDNAIPISEEEADSLCRKYERIAVTFTPLSDFESNAYISNTENSTERNQDLEISPLKQQAIKEIQDVEKAASDLEIYLQKEASSQAEMNQCAGQIYQIWDTELNILWGYLKESLSSEEMEVLTQKELEWISYKEKEADDAGKEFEGGSMRTMVEASKAAELTKIRVYELLEQLP